MKLRIFPIILATLMTHACTDPGAEDLEFATHDEIRLEVNGRMVMEYDENTCQIGFNRDRCEFRIMSDTASDYFTVKLDKIPSSSGETLDGTVKWTTETTVETRHNIALRVVKLEGDRIWLRDTNGRIAVCLRLI